MLYFVYFLFGDFEDSLYSVPHSAVGGVSRKCSLQTVGKSFKCQQRILSKHLDKVEMASLQSFEMKTINDLPAELVL